MTLGSLPVMRNGVKTFMTYVVSKKARAALGNRITQNITKGLAKISRSQFDEVTRKFLRELDPSGKFPKQFLLDIEEITKAKPFPDFDLKDFIGYLNKNKLHKSISKYIQSNGLTKDEVYSVLLYTSANFYKGLNSFLRAGQRHLVSKYANLLDNALKKLPSQNAKVLYRGTFDMGEPNAHLVAQFIKDIQLAWNTKEPYIFKEFLSTSVAKNQSLWSSSKVRIRIFPAKGQSVTKGGKRIDRELIAKNVEDDFSEVLYSTNTPFDVKNVKDENGIWLVDLIEK